MVPIEQFKMMSTHFYQTREVKLVDATLEEEYEFVDFQEMFTEKHVKPFSGDYIPEKLASYTTGSDYYKDYFVSFNPEDNDGLIGGDLIPDA